MTRPAVRPAVVALLLDLDEDRAPQRWERLNGQPLTDTERQLVQSATNAELFAAVDLSQQARAHCEQQRVALGRINGLLQTYGAHLSDDTLADDIALLFTPRDRAEYERLFDIVAPDGIVALDNGG